MQDVKIKKKNSKLNFIYSSFYYLFIIYYIYYFPLKITKNKENVFFYGI